MGQWKFQTVQEGGRSGGLKYSTGSMGAKKKEGGPDQCGEEIQGEVESRRLETRAWDRLRSNVFADGDLAKYSVVINVNYIKWMAHETD